MKSTPNLVSAQGGGGHHSSNSRGRGKKLSITQRAPNHATCSQDVYAANYDHANNYGYVSAEHDDHSAETHCTFSN